MKKKILLTLLIVSALVCLFAISVSAITYTYNDTNGNTLFSFDYENPNWKDQTGYVASNKQGVGFAKVDDDGDALTWYITDTATDDAGNKTFTVTSLKTLGEAGSVNGNGAYSFTSPVTNKNTVSVNFPDDSGIKTWAFNSFGGYGSFVNNNILFVYCPNTLTAFSNNPFQEAPVMVVEIDDETPITNIPQNFCHEARNITTINIPATVEEIYSHSSQNGAAFYNCRSLATATFAENSALVKINQNAFYCSGLTEIYLPNSVTTLGDRVFQNCQSLQKISFGASLQNLTQSLTYQSNAIQYNYLPKTITTSAGSHVFPSEGATKGVIFFNGTLEEFEALKILIGTNNQGRVNHTNYLEWDPTISDDEYVGKAVKDNKHYVVYGYNTCNAFYGGVHGESTTTYDFKDEIYTSDYCSYTGCQRCNETIETVVCGPLFVNRGYSKVEDGSSFTYGITINDQNIAKYVEITGESFKYGFVVGSVPTSAHDQIIDSEGNSLLEKTVAVDFTKIDYKNLTIYNVKIVGIDTDEQKGTPIYCCAYVIDGSNISYMGDAVTDKAVSVSSNSITVVEATTPKETEE